MLDNAIQSLLTTAQRMQNTTYNAKFNGAPLDTSAQAFIQQDNFGEWIGGTYYNLSQATPDQQANPTINGYALYQILSKPDNGGLEAIMPATGYNLDQYYALAQSDYNSGRPQDVANAVAYQQWEKADTNSFLSFQGQIVLAGASGGLSAGGLPFLASANAARGVGASGRAIQPGVASG